MNGICKCGGKIQERIHKVETIRGLLEWTDVQAKLPATVVQSECAACARYECQLFDADRHPIVRR